MDRIRRLSENQSPTEFFTCSICTGDVAVTANDQCDFCWYDFEATDEERHVVNESSTFRELSVHQWYARFHVTELLQSCLSPITIMHILHDCFRLSSKKPDMQNCLQTAVNNFHESVPWLRRLIRGGLPILMQPTQVERIYKFAAGIGRTPIWYKVTKDESNSIPKWSWTPYNPITDFTNSVWISCPKLLVSVGSYTDQVPVAENIFIIMFLHTFRPDPQIADTNIRFEPDQTIKNHIREDVLKNLPNVQIRINHT